MITPMWGKFEQFRGDAGLSIILKRTLHGGRGDSQGWQLQLQVKRRAKVKLIICIFVYIHTSGPPVFSWLRETWLPSPSQAVSIYIMYDGSIGTTTLGANIKSLLTPTLGANKSLLTQKFGINTAPFHFAIKRRFLCLPDSEKPDTSITDRITHLGSVAQKIKNHFYRTFLVKWPLVTLKFTINGIFGAA